MAHGPGKLLDMTKKLLDMTSRIISGQYKMLTEVAEGAVRNDRISSVGRGEVVSANGQSSQIMGRENLGLLKG